jgi:hypothetical protein
MRNPQTHTPIDQAAPSRREFFSTAAVAALAAVPATQVVAQTATPVKPLDTIGTEHWTTKRADGQDVRLFMWRKQLKNPSNAPRRGTLVFVHGSSVSSTPVLTCRLPGGPSRPPWTGLRAWATTLGALTAKATAVRTKPGR